MSPATLVFFRSMSFPNTPEAWLGFLAGVDHNGTSEIIIGATRVPRTGNVTLDVLSCIEITGRANTESIQISIQLEETAPTVKNEPDTTSKESTRRTFHGRRRHTEDSPSGATTPRLDPERGIEYGRKLAEIRSRHRIDQTVLARAMNKDPGDKKDLQGNISGVERGKRRVTKFLSDQIVSGLRVLNVKETDVQALEQFWA